MSGPFGSTAWMANPASGFYGFEISNSLRFDNASNQNLVFTPSSAGNLRAWTLSMWVKRGNVSDQDHNIFSANAEDNFRFMADDTFNGNMYSAARSAGYADFDTSSVYRDASAWYNIVYSWDSNNGTAANRIRVFVNGVNQTALSGSNSYPSQNTDSSTNLAISHAIGKQANTTSRNFDGYIAEVNFIDGTTHDASSFGELKNDIWIPKNTSGLTFGSQGYRLQFKQTGTDTDANGVGADTSGNTNHFAPTNITANDVVPDSPTNNFATYNAVDNPEGAALSEGNLKCKSVDAAYEVVLGTIPFSSGKYYWEQNATSGNAIDSLSVATTAIPPDKRNNNTGVDTNSVGYYAGNGGAGLIIWNDAVHQGSLAGWGAGDVMSVACDMDNKTIQFRKNNSLIYTASASANGNITNTWNDMIPAWSIGSGVVNKSSVTNFGQDSSFAGQETAQGNADENGIGDFYYAPPSGYLALCTANLPDPVETIDPAKGGSVQDYFNTVIYTGNGSNRNITGVGFQPDWVWIKDRGRHYSHVLGDSVRGDNKNLSSNGTGAEEDDSAKFRTFVSDGFQVGTHNGVNANNENYVAWNWKAGTSFSNDASSTSVGSIDSAGSVNTDVGFSIINFTGTGSVLTVAHGLSQAPEFIIEKSREKNDYWAVYAEPIGNTKGFILSATTAATASDTFWNNTSPTSSVWTVGTQNAVNNSGQETIAYCFHSVEGFSKIGTYTGNGNNNGAFCYTGFKPAWIIIKQTAIDDWGIYDNKRTGQNNDGSAGNGVLYPNLNIDEETQASRAIDLLSNGFKLRTSNATFNENNGTYVFMAFAEQPFKYANAR